MDKRKKIINRQKQELSRVIIIIFFVIIYLIMIFKDKNEKRNVFLKVLYKRSILGEYKAGFLGCRCAGKIVKRKIDWQTDRERERGINFATYIIFCATYLIKTLKNKKGNKCI